MKAAAFTYVRAASIDEACRRLAEHGAEAKLIAGGQSLVPMMAMRLARPAVLIDIGHIDALRTWSIESDTLRLGACVGQKVIEREPAIAAAAPLLRKAIQWVGHNQTRNRGTVGGSLAHADPAAELPLVACTLEARLGVRSLRGARDIAASDFVAGPMSTALEPDELLVDVCVPIWREARVGAAFEETAIRHGDFAIVAAAAQLALDAQGRCVRAALGVGGADATARAFPTAAARLIGRTIDDPLIADIAGDVARQLRPSSDLHASVDYRRHLARVLVARVLQQALDDAKRGAPIARDPARSGKGVDTSMVGLSSVPAGDAIGAGYGAEPLYPVTLEVNGTLRNAHVSARTTLVDLLRDEWRLTGTHVGCEHGICGACSVLLEGEPVRSCLAFAVQLTGQRVTTVEGLSNPDGSMSVLQDSFCETHGLQCGYCTPGMLIAAHALLADNPRPTEHEIREAISGNLCRCTGYQQIVDAVQLAARRLQA